MSDEAPEKQDQPDPAAAEAPVTDQPINGNESPESGEPFFEFDPTQVPEDADREWLGKRHAEMQSAFTRKTMETAKERQEAESAQQLLAALNDPETAPALLSQLGWEVEAPDLEAEVGAEEGLYADDPRIDHIQSQLQAMQAEQASATAEELEADLIAEQLVVLEKSLGRELTVEEHNLIADQARLHSSELGVPDVAAGFESIEGIMRQREQAWRDAKKAPRRLTRGQAAETTHDLSTREGRIALAAEITEAGLDDSP